MSHPLPETLIPHQGAMCLLERIIEWDQDHVLLTTTTHQRRDNPLRHQGRLRAVNLCEYGAQAMAVHGALISGAPSTAGMLVSLRSVEFSRDHAEDLTGELLVSARCLQATPTSQQYHFEVRHGEQIIVSGRAAVILTVPQ